MAADDASANGDYIIGPDYSRAPEFDVAPDVPRGTIHAFTMDSRDSKIYPGIRRLDNAVTRRRDAHGNRIAARESEQSIAAAYLRTVWVHVPNKYDRAAPAPLLIVQDGHGYLDRVPRVLDNLIAQRRVPALVTVLIDSGGGDAQGSQRGLEYDTLSGRYGDFVESEVLPRITREFGIRFTNDPHGRATMGASSGAAAAFTMAWCHPERYRRVLCYSGTFVNQQSPPDPKTPRGAWEYHDHLIAESERKPLRVWLEVGEKDLHHDDPEESWHNWPLANKRMAAVLKAKGYPYRFTLSLGARHVDPRVADHTLPGALEWLWQGYGRA